MNPSIRMLPMLCQKNIIGNLVKVLLLKACNEYIKF